MTGPVATYKPHFLPLACWMNQGKKMLPLPEWRFFLPALSTAFLCSDCLFSGTDCL